MEGWERKGRSDSMHACMHALVMMIPIIMHVVDMHAWSDEVINAKAARLE